MVARTCWGMRGRWRKRTENTRYLSISFSRKMIKLYCRRFLLMMILTPEMTWKRWQGQFSSNNKTRRIYSSFHKGGGRRSEDFLFFLFSSFFEFTIFSNLLFLLRVPQDGELVEPVLRAYLRMGCVLLLPFRN